MTDKNELFSLLINGTAQILMDEKNRDEKFRAICKLLRQNVSYYDWVGFYLVDKERRNELLLGPFEGEPTVHVRIPFGEGVCGQAAELRKAFVVQDVSKEMNYLPCSANVKSEIVIPIFKNEEVVGEIDIDSFILEPFTKEDETFLRKIGEMVSGLL